MENVVHIVRLQNAGKQDDLQWLNGQKAGMGWEVETSKGGCIGILA